MANTTLLLRTDDITRMSSISGNVDIDKLTPFIYTAQKNEIRRILTRPLYEKIVADYEADTLTGAYKTIYEEYVVDMLVYFACADFIKMGAYSITNGGVFKNNPDNADSVDLNEIKNISSSYKALGNAVELEFKSFMGTVNVSEYSNTSCASGGSSFGFNWVI